MSTPPTEFVPRAEPVWLAALRGDDHVLRQLAEHLTSDELRLHMLGADWVAYTSRLQRRGSAAEFADQVRSDVIPVLNWLGRYVEPHGAGLHLDHIIRLRPDGTPERTILGSMGAREARGLPATICGESGVDQLVRLAWESEAVLEVIKTRELPDGDRWSDLYRIRESIAKDMGGSDNQKRGIGRIVDMGWSTEEWMERFRDTARPNRHGSSKKKPTKAMPLDEAHRGIGDIFDRWIDWKLGELARSPAADDDH